MITKEYADGLTEVLAILEKTETEYVNRIPEKVRQFFRENASKEYIPDFDNNLEIKDMNLRVETKHILSVIYLNYWAKTEEERNEFRQILLNNQKSIEQENYQKYNPNKVFQAVDLTTDIIDKDIIKEPIGKEESLVPIKRNFFQKLIDKIINKIHKLKEKM